MQCPDATSGEHETEQQTDSVQVALMIGQVALL